MGQLAQRVRASLHKYRLVWLVILVGLFLLLLPTGGGEGEEAAAEPAQGTFDLEKTEARLALRTAFGAGKQNLAAVEEALSLTPVPTESLES